MRLLSIVNDDSGLFVARNMGQLCERQGIVTYNALLESKKNREFVARVSADPYFDFIGEGKQLYDPTLLNNFDAIFFAKPPLGFPTFCRRTEYLDHPARPLIIGAYPGLEFSPDRGFKNRLLCDVILFNTKWDLRVFQRLYGPFSESKLLIAANPTMLNRWRQRTHGEDPTNSDARGSVFLGQSITPPRLSQRVQILQTLQRQSVAVKIRQRPREGAEHVHRELFGYESIAKRERISSEMIHCTMDEALRRFETFVSCSSTGVPEAAAAGKHVGQLAAFPGWEHDPLHLASLGYTLRHGLAIDEGALASGVRPNAAFFSDFELVDSNEFFALKTAMESLRKAAHRQAGHTAWKQALKVSTPALEVAHAFGDEGNPQKGAFLALSELVASDWDTGARTALDKTISYLSADDPAHSFIEAVLASQGSPGDILRMQSLNPDGPAEDSGRSSRISRPTSAANITRMRRKLAKLRKDPRAFFRESRHRPLRAFGKAFLDG